MTTVPTQEPGSEPRAQKWTRWFGVAVGAAVFAVALYSLRREFASYSVREVRYAVRNLDPIFILQGALFTVGAYAMLIM